MHVTWVLFLVGFLVAALFAVIAWALRYRRAYWLISGYNMMSEKEKSRVDVSGLARMMFWYLLAGAGVMLVAFVLMGFGLFVPGVCVFGLIVPWVILLVVRAQRFDAGSRDASGKLKPSVRWLIVGLVAFLALTGVFVAVTMAQAERSVRYTVADGKLVIDCSFGSTVTLSQVDQVELLDALPPVASRSFGSDTGSHLKGNFKMQDGSSARIYARTDATAVVRVHTNLNRVYLLSGETAAETRQLYAQLGGK